MNFKRGRDVKSSLDIGFTPQSIEITGMGYVTKKKWDEEFGEIWKWKVLKHKKVHEILKKLESGVSLKRKYRLFLKSNMDIFFSLSKEDYPYYTDLSREFSFIKFKDKFYKIRR